MALIPDMDFEVDLNSTNQPSKTYSIDWETGTINGYTDGLDSIKQFIQKTLSTERNKYAIYTDDIGVEFSQIREGNLPDSVLAIEIPRLITEALKYDDRIIEIKNFKVDFQNTSIAIYFEVNSIYGSMTITESL